MSRSAVLRAYLEHPDRTAGTLGLAELQGFLFAIANSPEFIAPVEWVPAVFGEQEPAFTADDEAPVTAALMEEYEAVEAAADDGAAALPPGCTIDGNALANLEERSPLARWSRGFVEGHRWLQETWELAVPDDDSEIARELAFTVLALSFFSSRRIADALAAETGVKDIERIAVTMAKAVPSAVGTYVAIGRTLRDEWSESSEPVRRAGPKIGRNDPCLCGSGRKYKRCCGAPN